MDTSLLKTDLSSLIENDYTQLMELSNYTPCDKSKSQDELRQLYDKLEINLWDFEEYCQQFTRNQAKLGLRVRNTQSVFFTLNDKYFKYRYLIPRLIDVFLVEHFFNDNKVDELLITNVLLCIDYITQSIKLT